MLCVASSVSDVSLVHDTSSIGRDAGSENDVLFARDPDRPNEYARRAELGDPLVKRVDAGPYDTQVFARGNTVSQEKKKKPARPPHIVETNPDGRSRVIHYHPPPRGRSDWRRANIEGLLFGRAMEDFEIDELD